MKTQAWGWLAAGVLAAGLNAAYYDGGLAWAHCLAGRIDHASEAVLALAGGRVEQFFAETRLAGHDEVATGGVDAVLAQVQAGLADREVGFARVEAMSARRQAQLARVQAVRARIEAQVAAREARCRVAAIVPAAFVQVAAPSACPRVRVSVPQPPRIHVSTPVIQVQGGSGPI